MGITAKKQEKRTLLSHEETLDLIDKVQRTGDEQAKEILIENYINLKIKIKSRYHLQLLFVTAFLTMKD